MQSDNAGLMHSDNSGLGTSQSTIQFFCCYEIERTQQPQETPFHDRMPMLGRDMSSKIRFNNPSQNNRQPIYELLNELYDGSTPSEQIYRLLSNKRINPILQPNYERNDLQYFIPQLVTFLVIERNLQDRPLIDLLLNACTTDFYFAHLVYFYLKSLSVNHNREEVNNVCDFIEKEFIPRMRIYRHSRLSGMEFTRSMIAMEGTEQYEELEGQQMEVQTEEALHDEDSKMQMHRQIQGDSNDKLDQTQRQGNVKTDESLLPNLVTKYGTKDYDDPPPVDPPVAGQILKARYCPNGFLETPRFWDDLIEIGMKITTINPNQRMSALTDMIKTILNHNLPAAVYVPFFKDRIRLSTVLAVWPGRIFSTKQRAPFSVWLQLYREEEENDIPKLQVFQPEQTPPEKSKKTILSKIYEAISRPFSINDGRNTLNIRKFITQKLSVLDESVKAKKEKFRSFVEPDRKIRMSQIYDSFSQGKLSDKSSGSVHETPSENSQIEPQVIFSQFFPQRSSQFIDQMRRKSIYRQQRSWRLIHLMIKTGDDIKQEQFAMQLITRFQHIFSKQKIDCVVFPYEVISMGPDCGLIEMINDITTLDKLFEKLSVRRMSLKDFFNYFPHRQQARRNFLNSLAGYSLLTYFLQIKDRHNGNILLHRDGHIIHIDFGFFLSNTPGKGVVEFEKKVPFKLLSQHVQVIGHLHSDEFFEFRQLFLKGFRAILKHKESILSLVRMMFSCHGSIMSCFIKGEQAINDLENRFTVNPQDIQNFCYELINLSLDNWRARWYDKFQYFIQKIYY